MRQIGVLSVAVAVRLPDVGHGRAPRRGKEVLERVMPFLVP
jgi:hypothetical protein